MLFLAIFATLLVLYFGMVDPYVKKHKVNIHKRQYVWILDAAGVIRDLLKF
jgi:hypothetical protein